MPSDLGDKSKPRPLLLRPPAVCIVLTCAAIVVVTLLRGGAESFPTTVADTVVLSNKHGVTLHILKTGAAIQRLYLPDKNGVYADVVLGFDGETPYHDGSNPYFGVIAGRFANRIANATFTLDGKAYKLHANEKGFPGSLHGGVRGFDKVKWEVEKLNPHARKHRRRGDAVRLSYSSADGEEGYPGALEVQVVYSLADHCTPLDASGHDEAAGARHCVGELVQSITGWTIDQPSVINLAQHTYFNLAGHDSGSSILQHELALPTAKRVLPVDSRRIPTGEFKPVQGTPFDFLRSHPIGDRIREVDGPGWREGYDHCFVLHDLMAKGEYPAAHHDGRRKHAGHRNLASRRDEPPSPAADAAWWQDQPKLAARLLDPKSGRAMEIATNAPGLQVYTSNFLDGTLHGKGGAKYERYGGVCLETQSFPDGPNRGATSRYPSGVIRPGEVYRSTTIYQFTWSME